MTWEIDDRASKIFKTYVDKFSKQNNEMQVRILMDATLYLKELSEAAALTKTQRVILESMIRKLCSLFDTEGDGI